MKELLTDTFEQALFVFAASIPINPEMNPITLDNIPIPAHTPGIIHKYKPVMINAIRGPRLSK